MSRELVIGHALAVITSLVKGMTFAFTKVLPCSFQPVEILWIRFILGFFLPSISQVLEPCKAQKASPALRDRWPYEVLPVLPFGKRGAGILHDFPCAVSLSSAPLFTMTMLRVFHRKGECQDSLFYMGFVLVMVDIGLICFHGARPRLHPPGDSDIPAFSASMIWAFYALSAKETGRVGLSPRQGDESDFTYGMAFMLPILLISKAFLDFAEFHASREPFFILLFLGLIASALCLSPGWRPCDFWR